MYACSLGSAGLLARALMHVSDAKNNVRAPRMGARFGGQVTVLIFAAYVRTYSRDHAIDCELRVFTAVYCCLTGSEPQWLDAGSDVLPETRCLELRGPAAFQLLHRQLPARQRGRRRAPSHDPAGQRPAVGLLPEQSATLVGSPRPEVSDQARTQRMAGGQRMHAQRGRFADRRRPAVSLPWVMPPYVGDRPYYGCV
jgi:hypothetical protein